MTTVFIKLLNMSIAASWLVLSVILFRIILKNAPKWIRCILWGLVAIRLICPISMLCRFRSVGAGRDCGISRRIRKRI